MMNTEDLKQLLQDIVKKANDLKNRHTSEEKSPVNYACIFCRDDGQYTELFNIFKKIGKVVEKTPTGNVFLIQPIETVAGKLQLVKLRKPDKARPELGDADFTVSNYEEFKKEYLKSRGFSLIVREKFEMIELVDPVFNVRAYFSNPTLEKVLGIK